MRIGNRVSIDIGGVFYKATLIGFYKDGKSADILLDGEIIRRKVEIKKLKII
jgi:hypothetical protein